VLSRYGGEEFVLALPACPLDHALEVVERLRRATPGHETCSAGMACWDGRESASELVERADRALYEAKRSGRDRVVTAPAVERVEEEGLEAALDVGEVDAER
jgi:diguanylate cyclase (GGDEF)-like protein